MGTIAEALVATAVGLFVAIPAVAAFNYFQRIVKQQLNLTETLTQLVLSHSHALHDRELREHRGDLVRSFEAPSMPSPSSTAAPAQA